MKMELAALCELPDASPKTDQLLSGYVCGSTHDQLTVKHTTQKTTHGNNETRLLHT